ncbi:hypothetical protein acdb102_13430 [Acidothermaceae bacterium B102]|nr:hypothetical protein acdb102_13430 [Acidothermaceae bacterium B102]
MTTFLTDDAPATEGGLPLRAALSCCYANLSRLLALDGLFVAGLLAALALAFLVPDVLQAAVVVLVAAPVWLAISTMCTALAAERAAPSLAPTLRAAARPALVVTVPLAVVATLLSLSVNAVRADGGLDHAGVVLVASLGVNGALTVIAVLLTPLAMAAAATGERGLRRTFLVALALAVRRPLAIVAGVAFAVVLGQLTAWFGPLVLVLFPAPVALLVQYGVAALLPPKDGHV